MSLLLPLFVLLLSVLPVEAAPTVACHCFQDRAFDPRRPTAADDYFLAAGQNALFAAVSQVDKRSVVQAKMGGADGAELWVSWSLAQTAGVDKSRIEELRRQGLGWRTVAERLRLPVDRLPPTVAQGVLRDLATAPLASTVVDSVLGEACRIEAAVLRQLRTAGADDRAAILALTLAQRTAQPALQIFLAARNGGASWGAQLQRAGIDGSTLEAEVRRLIVKPYGR